MKRKLSSLPPVRTSPVALAVAMALAASPWAHAGSGSGGAVGSIIDVTPIVQATGGAVGVGKVAMDAQGDFVSVWVQNPSRNGSEIYAQDYLAPDTAQGSTFLVSPTAGSNRLPSVAMDAEGGFVVAWENQPTSGSEEIYAQRYSAAGTPEGGDVVVSPIAGNNDYPSVAMDAAGDFVVAWENAPSSGSDEIYAQRYSAAGAAEGSAFVVSSTAGNNLLPAVAMDAGGDSVVAWENAPTSGSDEIYAQRYSAAGAAEGNAFLASSNISVASQELPSVAMDVEGDFVVAWNNYGPGQEGAPPYKYEIDAQRYAADGAPMGNPLAAAPRPIPAASNSANPVIATEFDGFASSVAMDGAGDFIIGESDKYYALGGAFGTMISAQQYASEENLADTTVSITSSDPPGPEGSAFSLSFQVENQNVPSFRTPVAQLNPFIGAVGDPTISITLPTQAASFPANGPDWICEPAGGTSLSCTYEGWIAPGQYSPALMVSYIAPIAGTLSYSAQVVGSSEPPVTGSISVTGGGSGSNGGGGGMDWLSLLGLLGMGFLIRRHRRATGRTSPA